MLYPQSGQRTMNVARLKPRQRTPAEEAAIVVVNVLDWLGVWC